LSRHVPPVSTSTTLGATYVDIGSVKFEPGVSLSAIELESPTAAALDAAPARNPIAKILRETQPNKPPPSPLPASSPRRSKGTVALSLSRTPASTSTTSFPTVSSRPSPTSSPTSSPPRARFRRSRRRRRRRCGDTAGVRESRLVDSVSATVEAAPTSAACVPTPTTTAVAAASTSPDTSECLHMGHELFFVVSHSSTHFL